MSDLDQPKKILVVGPAWVGDMVMSQTLYKILKNNFPNALLDVIAPAWSAALLSRMPEVNRAWPLPIDHGAIQLRQRWNIARSLRTENYDQAIVLPNSFKSALIPLLARITKRTGWRGEMRYGLLNDLRILDKKKYPLMIERFAALAFAPDTILPKKLPWPQLKISANNCEQAVSKFNLDPSRKPILALCPGAEFGPAKRWPAEYFAEIAREKISENYQVWLFGSAKDQEVTQVIQQHTQHQCIDLAGVTTLADAIDLLSLASIVVSNDSGLIHIASALNIPSVVIYGSTDFTFTPPLSSQAQIVSLRLPCSPCFERECPLQHLNCLNQLQPELVLSAIRTI